MMMYKKQIGWPVTISLGMFPVLFWLTLIPLADRFSTLGDIMLSLGQVTGIVGVVYFSLSFVLGARIKTLENYFGGMNQVYIAHHMLGGIAFIFLLIHPLFLAASYATRSLTLAAKLFLPGVSWSINFGLTSLSVMMALLFLTYYIPIKYHLWKFTHKFLGLAFFIGAVHGLFVPSDISGSTVLMIYIASICSLGLLAFAYRTLLWKLFVIRHSYRVSALKTLSDATCEVELEPINKKMSYQAGQFVFISFDSATIGREVHPFSLSSSPSESTLKIGIKALGDYTSVIQNLAVGTKANIEGAFGHFTYSRVSNPKQIWIGGGIGITPFVGMVKDLLSTNHSYEIALFYCVKNKDEAAYDPELSALCANNTKVKYQLWSSQTQGRLTFAKIAASVAQVTESDIFVCGPPTMMHAIKEQAKTAKIPGSHIHSEEFAFV